MCWDNLFALRRQNIVAWIAFFLWFKELQILRPALPWSALTLLLHASQFTLSHLRTRGIYPTLPTIGNC